MCETPCGFDIKPTLSVTKPTKVCRRCGAEPNILLDGVHLECKVCFLESCAKKIRSTIGKTQLLKNNDSVILAYSGGPSSRALLELLRDSIEKSASRREQKLKPTILHVDTRTDLSHDVRTKRLHSLLNETSLRFPDWPLHWASIDFVDESSITLKFSRGENLNHLADGLSKLVCLAETDVKEGTSVHSMNKQCALDPEKYHFERSLRIQKRLLNLSEGLIEPSQSNAFVFSGDNATTISNNVIKSVIFGQGDRMNTLAQVAYKDADSRASTMRPLRDFSARELAFYLRLKGIDQPVQYEESMPYSRIADKTESYLANLDVIHSSTYSTLTGVATRMRPKRDDDN